MVCSKLCSYTYRYVLSCVDQTEYFDRFGFITCGTGISKYISCSTNTHSTTCKKYIQRFQLVSEQKLSYYKYGQAQIPADLIDYEPSPIPRLQTEYAFVASPYGNGFDCHRTWEALCLGCIPIVKISPLDRLFANLPVLLNTTLKEFTSRTFDLSILD